MKNLPVINCLFITLVLTLLSGCSATGQKTRTTRLEAIDYSQIKDWDKDNHGRALKTFVNSCEKFIGQDPSSPVSKLTDIGGLVKDWQEPCVEAMFMANTDDNSAREFFEKWFTPYRVVGENNNPEGTLTGYYEMELEGSTKKTNRFKYPIYRRPNNIDSLIGSNSFNHASINDGILNGKGLEVAWVDNKAKLYFMQIQGSGNVKLENGKNLRLSFDGHNGHKFTGISSALKSEGMQFSSYDAMIDWLHKNPHKSKNILESDPSYVFFKPTKAATALGGHGVPLQTERSLAIDAELYPYGTPIWVETKVPNTKIYNGRDYSRLFVAQDTGGAIKGPIRGDVFFGTGRKAELVAGNFKTKGKFFVLFPKTVAIPSVYTAQ
jgi:membrane-bound lytic murein transglycosylase A